MALAQDDLMFLSVNKSISSTRLGKSVQEVATCPLNGKVVQVAPYGDQQQHMGADDDTRLQAQNLDWMQALLPQQPFAGPCLQCRNGQGPFLHCTFLNTENFGACSNCHFEQQARKAEEDSLEIFEKITTVLTDSELGFLPLGTVGFRAERHGLWQERVASALSQALDLRIALAPINPSVLLRCLFVCVQQYTATPVTI
ncbi:hypothetical protein LTR10_018798 [Elasticomyces elasticus]|uniref:ZZ-type domain-containing protein n=1 Tax=Exophiala sideris TaxID=1016849 RepID=A0ABR0J7T2_9EURO|nr:hypothetical protein LTR10_018798 [Elasticomyces elasticus]KAK5029924.1 hypothetical protein LTS07_005648 [Exophiala sideris]KAK5031636.1 hypothetical protein LTR13_007625 [Exophiala sideris]KAK5058314.1 hypothetical protein LTR69_006718 [Exophiala sideris]KAK5180243.1 hypothetical protein LTR44_007368 [Eurotiomycetes sp. CCFEE 6388]